MALLFVMVVPPVPAVGPSPKVVEGVVVEGVVVGLSPVVGVVLPFPAVLITDRIWQHSSAAIVDISRRDPNKKQTNMRIMTVCKSNFKP